MGVWGRGALGAAAVGLLALGGGCHTTDKGQTTEAKKPDVTQPGVLPPPQEMVKPASGAAQGGGIHQALAESADPPRPTPSGLAAIPGVSSLSKFAGKGERRVVATDMAVGWQPRIAHLPDPARNGALGCGLVGQMFIYGGPHLQPVEPDGILTVDLIDETPRTDGQPAAKPERWQFTKDALRKLMTVDETFGRSYVLFLPWPDYKPDVTKVRLSARYDPEVGHTLYSQPSTITIDTSAPFGAPVWKQVNTPGDAGGAEPRQPGPAANPGVPQPSALPPSVHPGAGGMVTPATPPGPGAAAGTATDPLPPIVITAGRP
jgi:hypothetical protein